MCPRPAYLTTSVPRLLGCEVPGWVGRSHQTTSLPTRALDHRSKLLSTRPKGSRNALFHPIPCHPIHPIHPVTTHHPTWAPSWARFTQLNGMALPKAPTLHGSQPFTPVVSQPGLTLRGGKWEDSDCPLATARELTFTAADPLASHWRSTPGEPYRLVVIDMLPI